MHHKVLQWGGLAAALASTACCVAASMPVRTPDGEVPAGEVAVGDEVVSIDVSTGQRLIATVVQVRRATRECLALRWQGGALVCTPDHPLYSPETGTYRPASDWVTGSARTLLIAMEDGVRVAAVEKTETFAGMHEVIDLTLDVAPHNFVAAGVVVHNKSPEPDTIQAEAAGPTVVLGVGEQASFRIFACADGEDHPELSVGAHVIAKTAEVPKGNVPFELTIGDPDTAGDGSRYRIPYDGYASVRGSMETSCSEGHVLTLSRTDMADGGSIEVSWTAEASLSWYQGENGADEITVMVEPEPAG